MWKSFGPQLPLPLPLLLPGGGDASGCCVAVATLGGLWRRGRHRGHCASYAPLSRGFCRGFRFRGRRYPEHGTEPGKTRVPDCPVGRVSRSIFPGVFLADSAVQGAPQRSSRRPARWWGLDARARRTAKCEVRVLWCITYAPAAIDITHHPPPPPCTWPALSSLCTRTIQASAGRYSSTGGGGWQAGRAGFFWGA